MSRGGPAGLNRFMRTRLSSILFAVTCTFGSIGCATGSTLVTYDRAPAGTDAYGASPLGVGKDDVVGKGVLADEPHRKFVAEVLDRKLHATADAHGLKTE